jgi:hypothetical protein
MDFKEYVRLQVHEIEKHKWIESEKARRDLTGIAEFDWISKYAQVFREEVEREFGPITFNKICN